MSGASRNAWLLLLALAVGWGLGCADAEPEQLGNAEPFRVRDAQFVRAPLPGQPALDPIQAAGAERIEPSVTALETANSVVLQGQAGKPITGRVSLDARAIALALDGVGDGYWVLPVADPDPVTGELTWRAVSEFGPQIPAGRRPLRVVAIDAHGRAGRQLELGLCIGSRVPDNLNACDPSIAPPGAVIALSWDADADLDLQVLTPEGRLVDAKQPSSVDPRDGQQLPSSAGAIDRDSLAACVPDGVRGEALVWNAERPSGQYGIYVSLFDACKQAAVRFSVDVYVAEPRPDDEGHLQLVRVFRRGGELLEPTASAGRSRGLFVTEFEF